MRHEPRAEHRLRELLDLAHRLRELHAAGLAAPTGVHLGFDNPQVAAELRRGGFGFGRCAGHLALGHGDGVIGEQLLRLVLVKIHAGFFYVKFEKGRVFSPKASSLVKAASHIGGCLARHATVTVTN